MGLDCSDVQFFNVLFCPLEVKYEIVLVLTRGIVEKKEKMSGGKQHSMRKLFSDGLVQFSNPFS
jgi:hypothetical protein